MEKDSTISYKVYPNERLKPVSFHGIETHPLYIQVIYDRKPIYFKSYFFDLLSKEKYSLDYIAGKKIPVQKEIIAKEKEVLAFLIKQQNKNFSLDSFRDNYYYSSKDLLSLMDDRFKDYLGTFFEDQGLPEFRSLIEAGRETIMSAALINGFRSALKPQLFKMLLENAPYYGPPYLPLNDFIQQVGMVPKEWEVNVLEKYCDRISVGIATSSSTYFTTAGILFLRNQNIKENRIDLSDTIYITNEFAEANSSKYLKDGDVITVRTGYPGISAVVPVELEGSQTFTTLITTPKRKQLNSFYLSYFINSDFGREQVLSLQGGGAQQNLNSGALETMLIFRPEIIEQEVIVLRMKTIEKSIEAEQNYMHKLQQIKAGLMGDLLSGRNRVNI